MDWVDCFYVYIPRECSFPGKPIVQATFKFAHFNKFLSYGPSNTSFFLKVRRTKEQLRDRKRADEHNSSFYTHTLYN